MKEIESNQKQVEGGSDLFREERRQAILDRLAANGRVSVAELSASFGVSEVTVRADLQALADRKLIVRRPGSRRRRYLSRQQQHLARHRPSS
jgi:DeoR/GlpR family transcriptional regulator of sugar metabolism